MVIHLGRGQACIDCRRRKVKCDGELPACRRCMNGGHGLDCEYPDPDGRTTHIQLLEDNIAKLESRIAEMESTATTATHRLPLLQIQVPGRGGLGRSAPHPHLRLIPPTPFQDPHIQIPDGWWRGPRPPLKMAKLLVDCFAPYAFTFAFFMHGPRTIEAMFPSSNGSPHPPPSPHLVNVIYLWGVHLSGLQCILVHESLFLRRAVEYNTSGQQPHHIVQNIQAEILLANYFLRRGELNTAMHRLNSALSLCVSYGLHQQTSTGSRPSTALHLPPPRDSVENGERVDAFWATLLFLKALTPEMQTSRVSVIIDDMISTPFPLEMSSYETGVMPANPEGLLTLKAFIDAPSGAGPHQLLTLTVKSSALYERATYFGVQWQAVLSHPDEDVQFRAFEQGLFKFIHSLPPVTQFVGPYALSSWLTTGTMAHVSVIQLHSSRQNPDSRQKCMEAAEAVVKVILDVRNREHVRYVNPIVAPMWFKVCEVFASALKDIYEFHQGVCVEVKRSLQTVVEAMAAFSTDCHAMKTQLARAHAIYNLDDHFVQDISSSTGFVQ